MKDCFAEFIPLCGARNDRIERDFRKHLRNSGLKLTVAGLQLGRLIKGGDLWICTVTRR